MAAAVATEEVLQHVGPDPLVEDTSNAAAEEELVVNDEEILRFMDSADGYLLLMDSLSSVLRQVGHAGCSPLCARPSMYRLCSEFRWSSLIPGEVILTQVPVCIRQPKKIAIFRA